MISLIIPAHNEEKVIATTLKELVGGVADGELEIIVVCNGCTDNTAKVVAGFGKAIRCIETPIPSKSNALNLGDEIAQGFPRIYQDADVILSLETVRRLTNALSSGSFLAASPKMQMDLSNSSWLVRGYYEVWQELPYVQRGMIGTGVYALSREGRRRFEKFPAIIADDRFIRALFKEHERTVVSTCSSVVRAPTTIKGLIKIKTRSRLGGYEFEKKYPELLQNEEKNYCQAIWGAVKKFKLRPALAIYLLVNLWCRLRARHQLRSDMVNNWERDETSRDIRIEEQNDKNT